MRAELAAEIGASLRRIDQRLMEDDTKAGLLVNDPKHKPARLHMFCPSLVNPDPWGIENYRSNMVHKKTGKRSGSKRR